MNKRTILSIAASALLLAACAHQPAPGSPGAPGLLLGLVHGFIVVFSLIGSLFGDVRVYAFPNSGFWYDLGFVIGAAIFFGGGAISVRIKRRGPRHGSRVSVTQARNAIGHSGPKHSARGTVARGYGFRGDRQRHASRRTGYVAGLRRRGFIDRNWARGFCR